MVEIEARKVENIKFKYPGEDCDSFTFPYLSYDGQLISWEAKVYGKKTTRSWNLFKNCSLPLLDLSEPSLKNKYPKSLECISFQDREAITGIVNNDIYIWDMNSGRLLSFIDQEGFASIIRINSASNIVAALKNGCVLVLNPNKAHEKKEWQAHKGNIRILHCCQDTVLTGGDDNKIKLWDTSGNLRFEIQDKLGKIRCAAISANTDYIATYSGGFGSRKTKVWKNGTLFLETKEIKNIKHMFFSSDCSKLVCITASRKLIVYNLKSNAIKQFIIDIPFTSFSQKILFQAALIEEDKIQLAWSPFHVNMVDINDGSILDLIGPINSNKIATILEDEVAVTLGGHAVLHYWNLKNGNWIKSIYPEIILDYEFQTTMLPESSQIVISQGKNIQILELKSGLIIKSFQETNRISAVTSSKSYIFVAHDALLTGILNIYDRKTFDLVSTISLDCQIRSMVVPQNEKTIIIGGKDSSIREWEIKSGKMIKVFIGDLNLVIPSKDYIGSIDALFIPPSGKLLLAGGGNASIYLSVAAWDIDSSKLIAKQTVSFSSVAAFAESNSEHEFFFAPITLIKPLAGQGSISTKLPREIMYWDISNNKIMKLIGGNEHRAGSVTYLDILSGTSLISIPNRRWLITDSGLIIY